MVYRRYAPYYNVVPKLFLPTEIEKLVDRKINKKAPLYQRGVGVILGKNISFSKN
jgi:hypothetical protein